MKNGHWDPFENSTWTLDFFEKWTLGFLKNGHWTLAILKNGHWTLDPPFHTPIVVALRRSRRQRL